MQTALGITRSAAKGDQETWVEFDTPGAVELAGLQILGRERGATYYRRADGTQLRRGSTGVWELKKAASASLPEGFGDE